VGLRESFCLTAGSGACGGGCWPRPVPVQVSAARALAGPLLHSAASAGTSGELDGARSAAPPPSSPGREARRCRAILSSALCPSPAGRAARGDAHRGSRRDRGHDRDDDCVPAYCDSGRGRDLADRGGGRGHGQHACRGRASVSPAPASRSVRPRAVQTEIAVPHSFSVASPEPLLHSCNLHSTASQARKATYPATYV
jgi:hypothetical protein